MKRDEALKLLGLEGAACDLTPAIVTRAFRQTAVASHPDTGGQQVSQLDMPTLQAARDLLLNDQQKLNNACPQCRGRGSVRFRMGVMLCGACKGTGETHGR